MREIKFRGKRIKNGEWVYGDLLQKNSGRKVIMTNLHTWGDNPDDVEPYGEYITVDPNTVGQYTGIKDKNGKEIYEGDIVKTPLLDPIFGDILADAWCNALIRFNQGSFVVSYYNSHNIYLQDLCDKIELLGNIHDNPELLNTK